MFQYLKKQSMDFIYGVWNDNLLKQKNMMSSDSKYFVDLKNAIYSSLTKNHKSNMNPILIKLGGQSGSGKTTQLMPSIEYGLNQNNIDFIHIAVRNFAKYHPFYSELLNKYGKENIREKTNGFALSLLFSVVEMLIKNKFNIFFEVTLLEPYFEEYLIKLSKYFNYSINYNILSIPLFLSNRWIENRKINSSSEGGRVVSRMSSEYFYNSLPVALEKIVELAHLFNTNDYVIIWSCYNTDPVYFGYVNEKILSIFEEYRKLLSDKILEEEQLLKCKKEFYNSFFYSDVNKIV